jgi:hypothetical protein
MLPPCSGTHISVIFFSEAKTIWEKQSKMSKSIAASGNAGTGPQWETAATGPLSTSNRLFWRKNNAIFFIEKTLAQFTSLENHAIIV